MAETVEITGIAGGGAGVGRLPDGRVTFVHGTAPGETVDVEVTEAKSRWTRSRLVRIRTPSSDRREAPCPHYGRCGGCTLEHLDYPAQLQAKAGIVADALQRIGGLDTEPPNVTPSPDEFRYRNRVSFTFRRGPSGVIAGFHELDRPDALVDIDERCLLPEAAIAAAWSALRASWGPDGRRLPSGEELRLTLRASVRGTVTLAVEGGYAPGRPRELIEAVPGLVAVWHRPTGAEEFRRLAGADTLDETWGGEEVRLGGGVFLQVNRAAAQALEAEVVARVRAARPERVVDAYCGVGLHVRRLAGDGLAVTGIEVDPVAVGEARRGAPSARVLEGRVEDRLPEALPADVVILNPPRAGLASTVPEQLTAAGPVRIVYVSCDPPTLARDLKRMRDAYRPVRVRAFDLFPQTAHVETLVELERCATT